MIVHVGTSGWNYKHWKEVFYPPEVKTGDWLAFYAERFHTVELNVTFYRSVNSSTFEKWRETTPPGFIFSVKMSRYVTHIKRLKIDRDSIDRFSKNVSLLKEKLGIVLIQLPPSLTFDASRVSAFFDLLDPALRYTVETRNETFMNDEFLSLLTERNIAWCVADAGEGYPFGEAVTADFVYVRMHGRGKLYGSNYRDPELAELKEKIRAWGKETYVYFNNDVSGYAPRNAARLQTLLAQTS